MSIWCVLVVLGVHVLFLNHCCDAATFYVSTRLPPNSDCPNDGLCFTLEQYASNQSYFKGEENVTLIFLQGTHHLNQDLNIMNVQNLILESAHGLSTNDVDIHLTNGDITIGWSSSLTVTIQSLVINGEDTHNIEFADLYQVDIVIQELSLIGAGLHLVGSGIQGSILISDSEFWYSHLQLTFSIVYHVNNFSVSICDCTFYSHADSNAVYLQGGPADFNMTMNNITILDMPTNGSIHSNVYISDARKGDLCGILGKVCDVCIELPDSVNSKLTISNSNFLRGSDMGICTLAFSEGNVTMLITKTIIANHHQGGFILDISSSQHPNVNLMIFDSVVRNNNHNNILNSVAASGISIYGDYSTLMNGLKDFSVVIRNTTFSENHDFRGEPIVIWLFKVMNVIIADCDFQNNKGTPIVAYYSDFTLSGNVTFIGNTANQGGAIALTSSRMNITKYSNIVFKDNYATDVGGAIFIEQQSAHLYLENEASTNTPCFYTLEDLRDTRIYSVQFINNTAKHGGAHIYGTSLQTFCIVGYKKSYLGEMTVVTSWDVQHVFHFEPNLNSSSSGISSNPTRVCMCSRSDQHECSKEDFLFHEVSVFPGEEFNISGVIVGAQFGAGTGSVYAQFLTDSSAQLVPDYQYSQGIRNIGPCTELNYSVYTRNQAEVMVLTVTDGTVGALGDRSGIKKLLQKYNQTGVIPPGLLISPVYININLLRCPSGFNLTGNPPACECYSIFKDNNVTCIVTQGCGLVVRSGTIWVNSSIQDEDIHTLKVFVHNLCPFGYCKPQQVTVDLNTPDSQCAFKRSGTLCGECKEGYSVAIGSSRCLQCDNRYLALLLFFAVAGILLVLFIKVLNLTVTQGTINGLIFYANIVWANQSILYPDQEHDNGASIFFKAFIAWLNLDFGIETCFIQGLNGYWKTWLQFVFPFYIWAIAGVIILVSRHSSLVTKLFGNTAVPMLATLFLLSYSKLLRTIITAMSLTFLVEYPSGHKSTVWSFDGNLQFCGIPHVFLFTAALAALLILWLPYTSVLLSVQWLQIGSEHKVLKWVDKLKPVFDAYFAPFKDKHRYWVGVLLLVRGVLLITFALTSANMPTANLLALVTVAVSLLAYTALTGHLYKKSYVSLLDTVSLLNLAILGGGALYTDLAGGNRAALVFTSVGIAFIQFSAIVCFHVLLILKHCRDFITDTSQDYESLNNVASQTKSVQENIITDSEDYSKLRESLLDDSIQPLLSGTF